jgi:chromosome segregation ATPase
MVLPSVILVRGPIKMQAKPLLIVYVLLLLVGCSQDKVGELETQLAALKLELTEVQSQNEALQSKIAEAQSSLSTADLEINSLQSATADLVYATERFDHANWRDVVPEVQSAASDVKLATGKIETSIDAVNNELE